MHKFQPLLELLRYKSIKDLEDAFGEDYESMKGIGEEDFNVLIKSKLCLDVKDRDVYHLFCQIDRYSKGSVACKELGNYICEYERKRLTRTGGPFETSPTMYPGVRSQDSIIEWTLCPEDPKIANEIAGHYFYVSRSGILCLLNKDMEKRFEATIETSDDKVAGKTTTWATSITCLPRERLIAVATTSGDIRFFRSSIYKFDHQFSIVCLPYIVLRLDCYDSKKLICGDFSGNVFIIQMDKEFFSQIRKRASHLGPEKMLFDHLRIGKIDGLLYEGADKTHFGPVQGVEYIPSLMAVISCSLTTKRAMMIHHLKNNESLPFTCPGGIICFAFCEKLNCIITGGADHTIKRWNPSVNSTHNELITGHTSPVTHVLVFENRQLLISADREKTVRVWDLLRPQCLQIIKLKEWDFPGKQGFSFVFLNPTNGNLILTTYKIGILKFYQTLFREKTHPCSEYIRLAAYSKVYNCLVTVGNASTISTWDAETGSLIYEFDNSHIVLDSLGSPRNMGILTAGLDPSGRRVITADRIGTVKVWNFHLGVCMKSFETNCTILSLSFSGFHIYAAGTSRVVIDLYDNGAEDVDPVVWEKRHGKTIVSLDCYGRDLLASATPDGEIIVWFRRSADAKIQMKDLKENEHNVNVDDKYLAQADNERRHTCSINQILFLQTREMDFFVGNLVSCGADGRIRFWNIVRKRKINEGKLLSKFKALSEKCHYVLCLATDIENHYLICGDTMGYVRIYELDNYYDAYGSAPSIEHKASPQQLSKFPFLKLLRRVEQKSSKFYGESEVGCSPFLLNCFRAHLEAVMSVSYACERDTLITAGRDSSVRLWTLSGLYIGRLGPMNEPWRFPMGKGGKSHMPPDVKCVASTFTLFVLNNGTTPLWSRALKTLKKCRLGNQPADFSEKPLKWAHKKGHSTEVDIFSQKILAEYSTIEEELAKRLAHLQITDEKFKN